MGLFDKFKSKNIVTPESRRAKSNAYIKQLGIGCFEDLPLRESAAEAQLKDVDTICKRAVACLFSIQLACDIGENNDYESSKAILMKWIEKFGVEDALLANEKRLFDNEYSQQDAVNVAWSYECYWSLMWALGLIDSDEIKVPDSICDCQKAIDFVSSCQSFEEFKGKTQVRNIEEILDMLDLYYRYHWACVDKTVNPETNIGALNPEVVWERRRGLEWLIAEEDDWSEISLDT